MMRTEWGSAMIASVLANCNKDPKTPPFKLSDFAPHIGQQIPITLEEARAQWF